MTDTFIKRAAIGSILGIAFLWGAMFVLFSLKPAFASAPAGLPAAVASTSNPTLTASTAVGIFATSTGCSARIVTTQSTAILLTFTDKQGQTPTLTFGHMQPASSTVAYDSGLYGCGYVKAISYGTQLITISDVQ